MISLISDFSVELKVRSPAGAHFVVALSKSHLPCLVLVEPRKGWTDDRFGQTVKRLDITSCLMC